MKKIILSITLWLVAIPCSAHKEWVHQYIVQEAYRYLAKQVGEIPALRDYAGINFHNQSYQNDYYGPAPNAKRPWEEPAAIAVGVWREDILDPIWEYYGINGPFGLSSGYLVSITHFWHADDGDDNNISFPGPWLGDFENAWVKARNYMFAGNRNISIWLDGDYLMQENFKIVHCYKIKLNYNNLCDIATGGNRSVPYGYYNDPFSSGSILKLAYPRNSSTFLSNDQARLIGFNIFGHVLHLLADMGVPAHTRNDSHGCTWPISDGDFYELAMGGNSPGASGGCNAEHYGANLTATQLYNSTTAAQQGGLLLEVFSMSDKDALRYMFYTMNQLSDYFASSDDDGNGALSNGSTMLLNARYPILAIGDVHGATNHNNILLNSGDYRNQNAIYIGDELMNYAIRVTATAMYWFAVKTGLVECPETLYQQSHTYYGVRTASENANFKASSKIIAGRNVNSNLTSAQGDVVVESGTLTYLAGDEIQLKDGFVVKQGAEFHAKIQNDCPLTSQNCTYTGGIRGDNPLFVNPNMPKNDEIFAKKGSPEIQDIGDTVAKCTVGIWRNTSLSTSGDTIFLSNWGATHSIPRANDTIPRDTLLVNSPIWIYADSLVILRNLDSVVRRDTIITVGDTSFTIQYDSLLLLGNTTILVNNHFSTIILTDSIAMIITTYDSETAISGGGSDKTPQIHAIYPNPNSDYIDMQIDGKGSTATVTIYTQTGVKISETTVSSSEKLSRVSTGGLAPGMYMAVVKTANGVTSKNFVVNR
jgi:hypothetical protein